MKHYYILIQAYCYNSTEIHAEVLKVSNSDNLLKKLDYIGGLISVNICKSRKEAEEQAYIINNKDMIKKLIAQTA